MEEKPKLSVIIPAYNEGKRIIPTLKSVLEYLNKQDYTSEVIVVANGCTDNTFEVAKSFESQIHNLNVMDVKQSCGGKGCAVKIGVQKAKGSYVLFMDADNATRLEEVGKFWKYFNEGYDVVIGSRAVKGAVIEVRQPWYRVLLGKAGNILIQIVALWGIKDTQCGFKIFTERAAKDIFAKQRIVAWGFDIELLALAKKFGYKIKEAPVKWYDVGESKVGMGGALGVFKDLFKIKWWLMTRKYEL